jgi:hypothetical protein
MSDIVERLRKLDHSDELVFQIMREAAYEIERLRNDNADLRAEMRRWQIATHAALEVYR